MGVLLKNKDTVIMPEHARHAEFCKNRDDFVKLFFSITGSIPIDSEEREVYSNLIKTLCREYMALVLNGKMPAFQVEYENDDIKKETHESYRELIDYVTLRMVEDGVPMVESKDGNISIDYKKS